MKRWMRKLTALLLVIVMLLGNGTMINLAETQSDPIATEAPAEATPSPEPKETDFPEESDTEEPTAEPTKETTEAPSDPTPGPTETVEAEEPSEPTQAPGQEGSTEPTGSPDTEESTEPSGTPAPEVSTDPSGGPTPEASTAPAETSVPEETPDPAATPTPEESTDPATTPTPEESIDPAVTPAPEESIDPTETPGPEETIDPDASALPSLEPSVEPEPSAAPSPAEVLAQELGMTIEELAADLGISVEELVLLDEEALTELYKQIHPDEDDTPPLDDPDFEIDENGVLTKYVGTGGDVVIPEGVTSIGDSAFQYTPVTSVKIPSSVTSIGNRAFDGCNDLMSIDIPSSVTSIGSDAFSWCRSLTSIGIPSSVKSIGQMAFYGCSSLSSIEIPNGVRDIYLQTFFNCCSLSSIKIPSSVFRIHDYSFSGCTSLTSVEIPSSVGYILHDAFSNCSNLQSVTLYDTLYYIESSAFNECSSDLNFTLYVRNMEDISYAEQYCIDYDFQYIKVLYGNDVDDPDDPDEPRINQSHIDRNDRLQTWSYVNDHLIHVYYDWDVVVENADEIGVFINDEDPDSAVLGFESPISVESNEANACVIKVIDDKVSGIFRQLVRKGYDPIKIEFAARKEGGEWSEHTPPFYISEETRPRIFGDCPFHNTQEQTDTGGWVACVTAGKSADIEFVTNGYINSLTFIQYRDNSDDPGLSYRYESIVSDYVEDKFGNRIFKYTTVPDNQLGTFTISASQTGTIGGFNCNVVVVGEQTDELSFTMQPNPITVGDSVTFQITAPNASKVQLIVDGVEYDEYEMTANPLSVTREFSNAGERQVQFRAYVNGAWTQPCAAQTLTVLEAVTPTIDITYPNEENHSYLPNDRIDVVGTATGGINFVRLRLMHEGEPAQINVNGAPAEYVIVPVSDGKYSSTLVPAQPMTAGESYGVEVYGYANEPTNHTDPLADCLASDWKMIEITGEIVKPEPEIISVELTADHVLPMTIVTAMITANAYTESIDIYTLEPGASEEDEDNYNNSIYRVDPATGNHIFSFEVPCELVGTYNLRFVALAADLTWNERIVEKQIIVEEEEKIPAPQVKIEINGTKGTASWAEVEGAKQYLFSLRNLTDDFLIYDKAPVIGECSITMTLEIGKKYRLEVGAVPEGVNGVQAPDKVSWYTVEFEAVATALNPIVLNIQNGDVVTEDHPIISWNSVDGAGYYLYSCRDLTTDTLLYEHSRIDADESVDGKISIKVMDFEAGHQYQFWACAVPAGADYPSSGISATTVGFDYKRMPAFEIISWDGTGERNAAGTLSWTTPMSASGQVIYPEEYVIYVDRIVDGNPFRMYSTSVDGSVNSVTIDGSAFIEYGTYNITVYATMYRAWGEISTSHAFVDLIPLYDVGAPQILHNGILLNGKYEQNNTYCYTGMYTFWATASAATKDGVYGLKNGAPLNDGARITKHDTLSDGTLRFTASLEVTEGKQVVGFYAKEGDTPKEIAVYGISRVDPPVIKYAQTDAPLRAWPSDGMVASLTIPVNTEVEVLGKTISDNGRAYSYVKYNGEMYFVQGDLLGIKKQSFQTINIISPEKTVTVGLDVTIKWTLVSGVHHYTVKGRFTKPDATNLFISRNTGKDVSLTVSGKYFKNEGEEFVIWVGAYAEEKETEETLICSVTLQDIRVMACKHENGTHIDPEHPHEYIICNSCNQRIQKSNEKDRVLSSCKQCFSQDGYHQDRAIDMAELNLACYQMGKDINEISDSKIRQIVEELRAGNYHEYVCLTAEGGFTHLGWIRNFQNDAKPLTEAMIMVETTGDGELVVTVTFQGSQDWEDWKADVFESAADVEGIHRKFNKLINRFIKDVVTESQDKIFDDKTLKELLADISKNKNARLRITGHSMGGSLAQIFAYRMVSDYGIAPSQIEVYTFAALPPFTHAFIKSHQEQTAQMNVYNYINTSDFAPDVGVTNTGLRQQYETQKIQNVSIRDLIYDAQSLEQYGGLENALYLGALATGSGIIGSIETILNALVSGEGGSTITGSNLGTNVFMTSDETILSGGFSVHAMETYYKLVNRYSNPPTDADEIVKVLTEYYNLFLPSDYAVAVKINSKWLLDSKLNTNTYDIYQNWDTVCLKKKAENPDIESVALCIPPVGWDGGNGYAGDVMTDVESGRIIVGTGSIVSNDSFNAYVETVLKNYGEMFGKG